MKKLDLKSKKPIIISGPCSAETREQTIQTCTHLAQTGMVDAIRAGVWKPRTKPGSFEGSGLKGLAWMAEVKELTGLPVAVEVATAKHVESALEFGVDILWIGARTTVSPFAVQEIAEAMKGAQDKLLLIKNPMNPDIDLWAGAVARFENTGIPLENIGLIHRGFSAFGASRYRNSPMWHIVIEMRRRFPQMAMICDPSHICGNRENLAEVSQTAADLSFDGLIVESHICPDKAWSDASQQLTPGDLATMLSTIVWRSDSTDDPRFGEQLQRYRSEIDRIDSELFDLLGRRMRIAEKIGQVKRNNNVAILQGNRWNSIVERTVSQSAQLGLSSGFITTILEAIHNESIERQNEIMNK